MAPCLPADARSGRLDGALGRQDPSSADAEGLAFSLQLVSRVRADHVDVCIRVEISQVPPCRRDILGIVVAGVVVVGPAICEDGGDVTALLKHGLLLKGNHVQLG